MSGPSHRTLLLPGMYVRLADVWNQVIGPGDNEADRGVSDTSASERAADSPSPWLGSLIFVSLLVMLNLPIFFTTITGMDLYGLFTFEPFSAPPWPLALSTLLSSSMAFAGLTCYRWLWRRQEWFTGGRWGPFARGAVLSGVPVALAYAPSIVLTSHGGKPGLIAVAGLMAGSLCVTHALKDAGAKLDPTLARYLFIGAIASILVFLLLSIGGMLVLYTTEQLPASGNLLWDWEYEWADLGYPREEFNQRQRDALVGFTLTGSGFMIIVLGGSMLGAILGRTRRNAAGAPLDQVERPGAPEWAAAAMEQLGQDSASASMDAAYAASFSGYEVPLRREQYDLLVGREEALLSEADLLIDKVSGRVLKRTQGGWRRIHFRAGEAAESRRSGPFLLLCIYASHPGKRFTNRELRNLLQNDLPDRHSLNVTDFFNQLRKKRPALPVARDGDTTYLPESLKVCLLTNQRASAVASTSSSAERSTA